MKIVLAINYFCKIPHLLISLIEAFLKAPYLVLFFSCSKLVITILSVICIATYPIDIALDFKYVLGSDL